MTLEKCSFISELPNSSHPHATIPPKYLRLSKTSQSVEYQYNRWQTAILCLTQNLSTCNFSTDIILLLKRRFVTRKSMIYPIVLTSRKCSQDYYQVSYISPCYHCTFLIWSHCSSLLNHSSLKCVGGDHQPVYDTLYLSYLGCNRCLLSCWWCEILISFH